jgi:hypothetical protein
MPACFRVRFDEGWEERAVVIEMQTGEGGDRWQCTPTRYYKWKGARKPWLNLTDFRSPPTVTHDITYYEQQS